MRTTVSVLAGTLAWSIGSAPAYAHRDDYIDETPVFLTLQRGEVEPEYWFDLGWDRNDRFAFTRHNLALEAGFTNHWMADARATLRQDKGDSVRFDSARGETRWRLGEEGQYPVDLASSLELNVERERNGDVAPGVEPRGIVSHDWGDLNLTLNLPIEIPLDGRAPSFDPSVGIRFGTGRVRLGAELKYFSRDRFGLAIPQLWIGLWEEGTLKLGYARRWARSPESFARIALEAEL